jgi:hypothetical protein
MYDRPTYRLGPLSRLALTHLFLGSSAPERSGAGRILALVSEPKPIEQAYRFELDPSAEQAVFLGACCGAGCRPEVRGK